MNEIFRYIMQLTIIVYRKNIIKIEEIFVLEHSKYPKIGAQIHTFKVLGGLKKSSIFTVFSFSIYNSNLHEQ